MTGKKSNKAEFAANLIGEGFLLAARRLRETQDDAPEDFALVAKSLGIGVRTSYYWANIDRKFRDLGVDDGALVAIGWSKLRLLCGHVTKDNCHQLLELASNTSAEDLRRILSDEPPLHNSHCVVLYFSDADYSLFAKAILAHGGSKSGRGLADKETALIAALSQLVGKNNAIDPQSGVQG
jgi:hypothetical protein